MTDEPSKKKLKKDIEEVDEQLRKLEAEEQKREERKLTLDDDLRTKSKMLTRPIIEGIRSRKRLSDKGEDSDEKPVTGKKSTSSRTQPLLRASFASLMSEAVLRHWDRYLRERGRREGVRPVDLERRLLISSGLRNVMEERMLTDLKTLEDSSQSRMTRIKYFNSIKSGGQMREGETAELRRLEDQEASRYWLRERLLRRVPLEKQGEITWLQSLGGGAFGVMPYTVLTTWDLMTPKQRIGARWHADNQLLRWQSAVVGQFMPKAARLAWFRKKAKKDIENIFEDIDEEIYSDKKWTEQVKKGEAQLEDIEEELRGYDAFTVEEEKEIKKRFTEYMREHETLAKEEQFYG